MDFPTRKPTRLQNYDYSQNECYFVTVCVKNRKPILSTIVGGDAFIAPQINLTEIGKIAEKHIQKINSVYAFDENFCHKRSRKKHLATLVL